jgi:hypothetical protein
MNDCYISTSSNTFVKKITFPKTVYCVTKMPWTILEKIMFELKYFFVFRTIKKFIELFTQNCIYQTNGSLPNIEARRAICTMLQY